MPRNETNEQQERDERAREWYAWERERNMERRRRTFIGCVIVVLVGLAIWLFIFGTLWPW